MRSIDLTRLTIGSLVILGLILWLDTCGVLRRGNDDLPRGDQCVSS